MMLVRKDERKEKEISKGNFVWNYEMDSREMGFALARINSRYPESGEAINEACNEIYYVMSGGGKIYIEGKEFEIKEGDVFLIEKGKPYHVTGDELFVAIPTTPSWYPEQHKLIEDK